MRFNPDLLFLLFPIAGLAAAVIGYYSAHREAKEFDREHPELKPGHRD